MPLTFWNNTFALLSAVSLPRQEHGVFDFYVAHSGERWEAEALLGGAAAGPTSSGVLGDCWLPVVPQSHQTRGRSLI